MASHYLLMILAVDHVLESLVGVIMSVVHHRLAINDLSANPDQPWIIAFVGFTTFVSS